VECWWSVNCGSLVHVKIKAKASEHCHDSSLEKTQEEGGSKISYESNCNNWTSDRLDLFHVFGDVLHDKEKRGNVSCNNTDFTEENKDLGKHVGEHKLQSVFQVQEESFPG